MTTRLQGSIDKLTHRRRKSRVLIGPTSERTVSEKPIEDK